MASNASSVPLSPPSVKEPITLEQIEQGAKIPALDMLKIFSNTAWEEFVLEWATHLKEQYVSVERCSGAGDKGRDVVAYAEQPSFSAIYDNFQCKHYDHPLYPSDICIELGKLCYFSFIQEFTVPRKYYIVAPQGVGTSLSRLIRKPDQLHRLLTERWETDCQTKIMKDVSIRLEEQLLEYVNAFDFSIVDYLPPLQLIEGHRKTPYYPARFGGGLPVRPAQAPPPDSIGPDEGRYVQQLLEAYSDHLKVTVSAVADLATWSVIDTHFKRAREQFYSAQALATFSRDTLQEGEFERLQEEVFHGIIDTVEMEHSDALARVRETVRQSQNLQVAHPLRTRMSSLDRGGMCHQFANEDRIKWLR